MGEVISSDTGTESGSRRSLRARVLAGVRARWKGCVLGVGAALAAWGAFHLLLDNPGTAEALVGRGPLPWLIRTLSRITGPVPIPLAELIVLGFLGRQALGVRKGWSALRRSRASAPTVLTSGAMRLAQDVGVLVFFFYLLWGFQYARPGLEERLAIEPAGEVPAEELRTLAERAVALTNEGYLELHGTEDVGSPTPRVRLSELVPALEVGWARVREVYELPARFEASHGRPKGFIASALIKRLGISGMYFPYTGEALVLNDLPGILQGKDLGHEMAHQRGVSSESDANVLGYLASAASPDPRVRYSGLAFIQRQLVSALRRASPTDAREVVAARLPGVTRDLRDLNRYWRPAQTSVRTAATRINDTMLRSHGIEQGVQSYSGSTWVFVSLARGRGLEALFL